MANIAISKTVITNGVYSSTDVVRELRIRSTDIVGAGTFAEDDTASFSIPILAGESVVAASAQLVTAFAGSGNQLNMVVGDGADADGYLATAAIHVDQTEIFTVFGTGDLVDGTTSNFKHYAAADTVDIVLDGTAGSAIDLNNLTAGEVVVTVWLKSANR